MSKQYIPSIDLPILHNLKEDLKNEEIVTQILHSGGAILKGEYEPEILEYSSPISHYLKNYRSDWDGFQTSPLRGKFVQKPGSARMGINYGPEINSFFTNQDHAQLFHRTFDSFFVIAQEMISSLFGFYRIPFSPIYTAACSILTASYYLEKTENSLGLKEHEDFGLATLGLADQLGLEYLNSNGKWTAVQPHQVLFHVGEWARRIFQSHGIHCNPFLHRVVDQNEGRFFLGMFYNPSFSSQLQSNFFNREPKNLSFLEFVQQAPSYT